MLDIALYVVLGALPVIVIAYFLVNKYGGKTDKSSQVSHSQRMSSFASTIYYRLDKILIRNRLTQKFYLRMRRKIELVTPADSNTIAKIAARSTLRSFLLASLTLTVMLQLGSLDIFYVMICVFTTYVIFTYTISARLERQDEKLLSQFKNFLSEIRHYYYKTSTNGSNGMVEEAIYSTIDHIPYEMGLHATKIYEILESEDVDYEVQKYNEIAPNRFIMTFVASCASILKFGDKRIGNEKQSVFLKGINYLKQEVNVEILKRERLRKLFSGRVIMTIVPLFLIKATEKLFKADIPELASYYDGPWGTISMVAIFLVSVLSYAMIIRLKDNTQRAAKDHVWLARIGSIRFIQRLLTQRINKNYTKSLRDNDLLKSVGEKMGPNLLLLQRAIYTVLGFLLTNAVLITITLNRKSSVISDYSGSYQTSMVTQSYLDEMEEVSKRVSNKYKGNIPEYDVIFQEITSTSKITNKNYATQVADTVMKRLVNYKEISYYWWYIPICLVIAFIASYIPILLLKYRKKIMNMSMEDEVSQFQTIILMLMHIDRMSLDIILEWMERFAQTFKEPIMECIQNLEMGDTQALEDLKASSGFEPFTRLVDSLMTIDKVSVANAFDEIETEHEYYTEKRKDDNDEIEKKKNSYGALFSFAPTCTLFVFEILLPFCTYAFSAWTAYNNYIK